MGYRSAGAAASADIELVDGASLYAEPSITGLNSQPVDDHAAFALLGARVAGTGPALSAVGTTPALSAVDRDTDAAGRVPTVELQQLTLRLLHSGSVALIREGAQWRCLDDLVLHDSGQPFAATRFAQRFSGKVEGKLREITRTFSISDLRLPNSEDTEAGAETTNRKSAIENRTWTVRDCIEGDSGEPRCIAECELPAGSVVAYPNGVGILYPAQRGYRRLEKIFATMERLQSGVNAKTIVSGYIGNSSQAHEELGRAERDVALFPTGVAVNRVASTAALDQLMREFETLAPLYLRRLHIVDISSDPRMSGVSRRLALAPMLAFVERVRGQLADVLARLGLSVSFAALRLDSIEERTQQYALLRQLRDDSVLPAARFAAQAAALLDG